VHVVQAYSSQFTYCGAKAKEERVSRNPTEERAVAKLKLQDCEED
jgi:hypothetical protein